MNEPRTDLGKALFLIAMPVRIWLWVATAALDSGAVVIGMRWRGPDGKTHWKESLR